MTSRTHTGSTVPAWVAEEAARWEKLWSLGVLAAALGAHGAALAVLCGMVLGGEAAVLYDPPGPWESFWP